MKWSVITISLVAVLVAGLRDAALGQTVDSGRQSPARSGLADAPIKSCRPISNGTYIQETQAVPPAPDVEGEVLVAPPAAIPNITAPVAKFEGGIHPNYVTSAEESHYISECHRCGRCRCRCTYAPLGASLIAAFGRQAYLGSVKTKTLYDYDFAHAALTVRGIHQLRKCVQRMEVTPGPIHIEAVWDPALDSARRKHVVELLVVWGIPEAEMLVMTVRTPRGREAIESLETSEGLLQQIRSRGRTIEGDDSATFSGGAIFGR